MLSRRSTPRLHTCMVALIILICSATTLLPAANAQGITQLSGTVVDASGALIAGATVQILTANGALQTTVQTDANGAFIIFGLAAGNYRLVISHPGLETKDVSVTVATTEAPAPLRISLAVSSVNTTIKVQGREDSLIGIADSASQGTVGAQEIQDRPILRSGRNSGDGSGYYHHAARRRRQSQPIFPSRFQSRPRNGLRRIPRQHAAEPAVARARRRLFGHERRHSGVCAATEFRERPLLR